MRLLTFRSIVPGSGLRAALPLLFGLALFACSDDDSSETQTADVPDTVQEVVEDVDVPEVVADVVEDAAGDTSDVAAGVVCGGVTCDPALAVAGTPMCCTVEGAGVPGDPAETTGLAPDQCGTDIGMLVPEFDGLCLQLNRPGELDESCPDFQFAGNLGAGCCTSRGFCGAIESFVGLGCIYPPGVGQGDPCGE